MLNPDPPQLEASRGPTWLDRLADYAKDARLPFYVLHRTPIIAIGFYVVQWQVNALVEYVVIALGTLVTTLVVYDIAVWRSWPTRFLFGLRLGR